MALSFVKSYIPLIGHIPLDELRIHDGPVKCLDKPSRKTHIVSQTRNCEAYLLSTHGITDCGIHLFDAEDLCEDCILGAAVWI